MKDFLFLVWVKPEDLGQETPEMRQKGVLAIKNYMEMLHQSGQLVSADPVDHTGKIVAAGQVDEGPNLPAGQMVGGYFLLKANSMDKAIELAKANPLTKQHKIEIREIIPLQ